MKSAVVSDTSPLNYLVMIEAIELLPRMFSSVIIPPAVAAELSRSGTPQIVRDWFQQAPVWLSVQAPHEPLSFYGANAGETEAIALAQQLGIGELLVDDFEARNFAARCGLKAIGTIAVLETASKFGWIDFGLYVERLRLTSFRIHEDLISDAKRRLDGDRR